MTNAAAVPSAARKVRTRMVLFEGRGRGREEEEVSLGVVATREGTGNNTAHGDEGKQSETGGIGRVIGQIRTGKGTRLPSAFEK